MFVWLKMTDEFCIPMKVKWTPFKICEECNKKKLTTSFYEVHDAGLNAHIDYYVCNKCMKEAKEAASTCFLCEQKFSDNDSVIEFFGGYAHAICLDKQMKENEERRKNAND